MQNALHFERNFAILVLTSEPRKACLRFVAVHPHQVNGAERDEQGQPIFWSSPLDFRQFQRRFRHVLASFQKRI